MISLIRFVLSVHLESALLRRRGGVVLPRGADNASVPARGVNGDGFVCCGVTKYFLVPGARCRACMCSPRRSHFPTGTFSYLESLHTSLCGPRSRRRAARCGAPSTSGGHTSSSMQVLTTAPAPLPHRCAPSTSRQPRARPSRRTLRIRCASASASLLIASDDI